MNTIQTFAQISPTEFTAILALFIGMLSGFYAIVRYMIGIGSKTTEADRAERLAFQETLKAVAEASNRVADATEKSASEAKQRNGHLAEMELQSQQLFKQLADRNYKAITNIKNQKVVHQTVEHETVQHKEDTDGKST